MALFTLFSLPAFAQHSVVFTWTAGVQPAGATAVTGYNLYQSQTSGSYVAANKVNPSPITGTTFTLNTGLVEGQKYFWVLRAVNAAGESVNSAEVNGTVPTTILPGPPILTCPLVSTTPGTTIVCKIN